jgi:hypothetical protein
VKTAANFFSLLDLSAIVCWIGKIGCGYWKMPSSCHGEICFFISTHLLLFVIFLEIQETYRLKAVKVVRFLFVELEKNL